MQPSLSKGEIERLEQGLPRLLKLGATVLVPFEVRRLTRARVVWLNERWFLTRNLDVSDESTRKRLFTWLCEMFGYAAPRPDDPIDAYDATKKVFHADRYGSMDSRTTHGGSGRAAIVGCFQAKGVGVTPLTGVGANWTHSHGCASLEEAVREAIYSEVVGAEFPHGAVPVIAILDAGLCFSHPSPGFEEEKTMRRAILVRPAVFRPAHIERACLFRESTTGYLNSQLDDVQRCRDAARGWTALAPFSGSSPDVLGLVTRIAEQIAFGRVHRLFNGGYFSSNLSIGGALLDFGAARALPDWANARTLSHVPGFGDEMRLVRELIRSLVFHFNKYCASLESPLSEPRLLEKAEIALENAFDQECLKMWGLSGNEPTLVANVIAPIRRYFALQQKLRSNYREGSVRAQGWLHEALLCKFENANPCELETVHAVDAALSSYYGQTPHGRAQRRHAWQTAVRFLQPRNLIDRDPLQLRIFQTISSDGLGSRPCANAITALIQETVGTSRRHWHSLPNNLRVIAHVSIEGSSALVCKDLQDDADVLWLEGNRYGNRLRLFDLWLSQNQLNSYHLKVDELSWNATVPAPKFRLEPDFAFETLLATIPLPRLQTVYPEMDKRWFAPRQEIDVASA